ncbi:RagB/SusD family nutrient uptake outer membrane protein [Sediminibacterium sp.]|uniref:RagB/SusD family nutrient uptake outer membrane protein n=1 Tax=Sediminibacterium sp. TaxID=1917865 RepID=UPI003F69FF16
MRFNTFLTATFLSAIAIGSIGCEKVLNEAPYNAFTDESIFTTPERATLALNGVYDAAQTGGPSLAGRGYPFGAANVQQGDCRGEDMINVAAFYQITYQGTYNPTSANNVAFWDNTYNMINKANIAIDGFRRAGSSNIITPALATQFEAECRFLRALGHHEMVTHFARPYLDGNGSQLGIPYRDYPVAGSAALDRLKTEPRPTVAFDYQQILADLNFAEANLPVTQTLGPLRATRGAAIALKMRVRMHMGQWDSVRFEGNKLIPASINPLTPSAATSLVGGYSLTPTPAGSFGLPGGNSITAENIFTIKNDPLDNGSVNGALASQYGSSDLSGRGLVSVSPIIWNNTRWLANDLRRTTLYRQGSTNNGTSVATGQAIMTTKYTDYVGRGDNNPIIRWAEVLLMQAEAEARLSVGTVSQRAIDLLNMVRNRASVSPATTQYTVSSFANDEEEIGAILLERRIEFLAEGKRWADIHRTSRDPIVNLRAAGIPAKIPNGTTGMGQYGFGLAVNAAQPAIPYSDFRFIWPIPVGEVTQNPIIVQNPGY